MDVWSVYTDGGCKGNPGPGGWGVVILLPDGSPPVELYGGEPDTTNNRMELLAAITGLEKVPEGRLVQMYTDSKYVKEGIEFWINNWRHNGWMTSNGTPVKNDDLWQRLDAATSRHERVAWQWVKGHAGNLTEHTEINERCDALATRGIQEQIEKLGLDVNEEPDKPERKPPEMSADRWRVYAGAAGTGTTGPGGWGVVAVAPGQQPPRENAGGEDNTNFNRMELEAVVRAVETTPEGQEVELLTASDYVLDGIANWIRSWKRNEWRAANGQPVKNNDLWKRLDAVCSMRKVIFTSVDDIRHDPGAKLAMELARAAQRKQEGNG